MSDSVRPRRWQPTRLLRPWDSPGKNTGVGCHFLLQCMKVKSETEVAQLCPTLSDPMDCSLTGSSVHGIFQARVLEWGAIAIRVCKMVILLYLLSLLLCLGFLDGSAGEESACNAEDTDVTLILGSERSPGGENASPLQYSCLENQSRGQRGLKGYSPEGCKELDTTEWLSTYAFVSMIHSMKTFPSSIWLYEYLKFVLFRKSRINAWLILINQFIMLPPIVNFSHFK